ncbi:PspA/IM30 family protein [Candidatus Contubernalis alkaliaceticus]|uniref:PspA/IM30 family protein n=1 Tax=Candidatus Contubernalis alkaliaceticus TaxID=338645 RepID=UPI001F4C3DE8|nr:PspA/IM30 family protein [Candidatus Contubernalis alkalaceticus]UNC91563.1 PspA/IM30 family protein [Candidatus Contubernalis alkalaceticus]
MGILNRFTDVVKSNINALIDKSEDPEKMANQIIIDLEKLLGEAAQGVAYAIAEEKRLKSIVEQNKAEMDRWEMRAMEALKVGDEELAREALNKKHSFDSDYTTYYELHQQQVEQVNNLKGNLRQLNEKIEEARRKRNNLIARSRSAKAQSSIAKAMGGASSSDALGKLEKMEQKVRQKEAMAEAYNELKTDDSLESRFKEIEKKSSIDHELAALKEKLKN